MERRIGSARGSFVPNSKLLQSEDIDIKPRGVFLNRLVKSRFSHGCLGRSDISTPTVCIQYTSCIQTNR